MIIHYMIIFFKFWISGQVIEGWFPIETSSESQNGEIRLCIQFVDFKQQGQSYDVSMIFMI